MTVRDDERCLLDALRAGEDPTVAATRLKINRNRLEYLLQCLKARHLLPFAPVGETKQLLPKPVSTRKRNKAVRYLHELPPEESTVEHTDIYDKPVVEDTNDTDIQGQPR